MTTLRVPDGWRLDTESAVGPCPDTPVAPRSRPTLLIRGSVAPAVRDAQRRLNAVSVSEVAAGRPALAQTPLVEDCVFGARTQQALIAFQQFAFPGVPAEHDGRLGPKTWAQLDRFAVGAPVVPPPPPPAAFVPPAPPSPALTGPRPVSRPCCMLASVSLAGLSTHGDHSAGQPNIVYTGKAGFFDLGHAWDTCDVTAWAYSELHRTRGAAGTRIAANEGEAVISVAVPATDWLDLARRIAIDDAFTHEIVSYPSPSPGGHNSSFSPEDLCSNNLGTVVAVRAIRAGGPFVAEAERQLDALLADLDGQSDAETQRAFDRIKNRWVDDSLVGTIARNAYLKRRNFGQDPWKAGHPSDRPTPAFVLGPVAVPTGYDFVVAGGSFARADFPAKVAAIRTDARARYGPDFDKP